MTTVIETSNGWAVSATVTCSPTASAPTPRRGVGLMISRAEHVARPARLASCPASRPTDAEREGRAKTFATETPRGWLAKHDKPTAARETRRRPRQNVAKM